MPARLTESRVVIGYPSGQDGAILWWSYPIFILSLSQGKFILCWCFIPYNKSFIDQACSVKMAGYWPNCFFFWRTEWTLTSSTSINTQKRRQYPAILTEQAWSIPVTHIYHPRQNTRNFGQKASGKTILPDQSGNFRNNRNVLKGSPKFPTEISE